MPALPGFMEVLTWRLELKHSGGNSCCIPDGAKGGGMGVLWAIPAAPPNPRQPSPEDIQRGESTETPGVPWHGGTLAGTLSQHRTHGWARAGSWHHSTYRPPRSHHSEHTSHMWTSPLGSERTHTHSRTLGELDIQTLFFFYFSFFFGFSGFSCISQNFLPAGKRRAGLSVPRDGCCWEGSIALATPPI